MIKTNKNRDKIYNKEVRIKISKSHQGKEKSAEHRKKLSEANKGKRHYNNGIVNISCYPQNAPEGFVLGILKI